MIKSGGRDDQDQDIGRSDASLEAFQIESFQEGSVMQKKND
jgi:hypothetical protein